MTVHVNYPHEAGYLYDCPECESGPCMCCIPCHEPSCIESGWHAAGAQWQHLAPCVSDNCEHPERDDAQ